MRWCLLIAASVVLVLGSGVEAAAETYPLRAAHSYSDPGVMVRTPTEMPVGDFNEDGHLDLVAGGLWLGNGKGAFERSPATLGGVDSARVVDLDHDGHLDLVTENEQVGAQIEPTVRYGRGDGGFGAPLALPGPYGIVGDFDGDGLLDVANPIISIRQPDPDSSGDFPGTVAEVRSVQISRGQAPRGFAEPEIWDVGGVLGGCRTDFGDCRLFAFASGDLTGDGADDLLLTRANNYTDSPVSSLVARASTGTFDSEFATPTDSDRLNANASFVRMKDLDRDGDQDPILWSFGSFIACVCVQPYLSEGDGRLRRGAAASSGNPASLPTGPLVGDYNGDGDLDLVVADPPSTFTGAAIAFGDGNGQFSGPVAPSDPVRRIRQAGTGDFNEDGVSDIALVGGDYGGSDSLQIQLSHRRRLRLKVVGTSAPRTLSGFVRHGAQLRLRCSLRCRVDGAVRIGSRLRSRIGLRSRVIAHGKARLPAATPGRIRLRLSKRVATRIQRSGVRHVRYTIVVTAHSGTARANAKVRVAPRSSDV